MQLWDLTVHVYQGEAPPYVFAQGSRLCRLWYHNQAGPHLKPNHYDILHPLGDPNATLGGENSSQVYQGCTSPPLRTQETRMRDEPTDGPPVTQGAYRQTSQRRKYKLKSRTTAIVTANVGGSRDAIDWLCGQAFDVTMIQEHRLYAQQLQRWILYTSPSPRDRNITRMPSSC